MAKVQFCNSNFALTVALPRSHIFSVFYPHTGTILYESKLHSVSTDVGLEQNHEMEFFGIHKFVYNVESSVLEPAL
jgi:hypothetical protein